MNSQSEEDYLKALYHLQKETKEVSTNSIADYLEMKPSSVTDMLKKLAEKNTYIIKNTKELHLLKKAN
jgi:DtxR family Mn-dependent transcriptional regulator